MATLIEKYFGDINKNTKILQCNCLKDYRSLLKDLEEEGVYKWSSGTLPTKGIDYYQKDQTVYVCFNQRDFTITHAIGIGKLLENYKIYNPLPVKNEFLNNFRKFFKLNIIPKELSKEQLTLIKSNNLENWLKE